MAYKQRSSGLPFKELGSSPVKQFPAMPLGASLLSGLTTEDDNEFVITEEMKTAQRKKDHEKKLKKKYSKKTNVFKGKGWSENKKT